ncbi:acetyl-CoA acetyltransferase [Methylorubrum populi]|uniref:Acetyl-CoA acetyltransferase n=1 Tax=Methylorubrum populi TaxID=223967 RepID=A0A160PGW1_9HYPH|nr:acetyl-CoA acetyltransferase [Methylorubrum populi]
MVWPDAFADLGAFTRISSVIIRPGQRPRPHQDGTVECRLVQIGLRETHCCGRFVPPPLPTPRALLKPLTAPSRWHSSRDLCELSRVARPAVRTAWQRHARPADPVDEGRLDAVAGPDRGGVLVEECLKLGKQPWHRIGIDHNVH